MRSPGKEPALFGSSRTISRLSLLAAVGIALYVVEGYLPRPVPWTRLGFSNVVVLVALVAFGFREALAVGLLRIVLGSMLSGSLFSPAFLFSLSGGLVSISLMGVIHSQWKHLFGPVGISVFGALGHNVAQFALAYLLYVRKFELLLMTPFVILVSIVMGSAVGAAGCLLLEGMGRIGIGFGEQEV
jgi:heptaprenyl diphosphate synthase